MAGKIKFLLYRDGRYYARRVVPTALRAIVGASELRAPLGPDRKRALDRHPFELVKINARIDHAREVLSARMEAEGDQTRAAARPMTSEELARNHYQLRLAQDEQWRDAGPTWASISIDDNYVEALRQVVIGTTHDEVITKVLGDVLDRLMRRGNLDATPFSAGWRQAARAIAAAELSALEIVVARDVGSSEPEVHPEHLQPLRVDAEHSAFEPPVSLRGLLEDHIKHLEASGRGQAARRAWPRVFNDLIDFVKQHRDLKGRAITQADDTRRLTPEEIIAWRDHKLLTLGTKTMKDVWLGALKAVLRHAVEDRKITSNPAADVKVRHAAAPRLRDKGYSDSEAIRWRSQSVSDEDAAHQCDG